jgi:hypothetical protein
LFFQDIRRLSFTEASDPGPHPSRQPAAAGGLERQTREESRSMKDEVLIRSETNADVAAIAEVTVAAFKTLAISNHTFSTA